MSKVSFLVMPSVTLKAPIKQTTNFICIILKKKYFVQARSYRECKGWKANSADPDEAACYEPPRLDQRSLLIQLFSFWRF